MEQSKPRKTMAKTRIKKNYVCTWVGPRGGTRREKFFTKEARDKRADEQKAAGIKVETSVQTRLKVNVSK